MPARETRTRGKLSGDDEFRTRHQTLTEARIREIYERRRRKCRPKRDAGSRRDAPHFHGGDTLRRDDERTDEKLRLHRAN